MAASLDPCLFHCFKGHRNEITGLKFNPNDQQLVSGSEDNSLMIWNFVVKDTRCLKFSGHTEAVTDVDWSGNGKHIASSSRDKTIRIWIPSVRGSSAEIKAHTTTVRSVEFSPDSKQLCSGSNDKSIKIWDVPRRKFITSFTGHNNWINCSKYMPDGNTIVSCADDKNIKIWDLKSKQCVHTFTNPNGSANKLAAHPTGQCVAAAMATGSVRVYEIRMQKMQQHYILHDKTTSVCWHPNGKHFLSAGMDGTMRIVDALEGRPLYTLEGAGGPISSIAFSANGDHFACACANKQIMIWQTNFTEDENRPPTSLSEPRS